MFTLGLTGGIGSGKTAASDYFASLGIVVVDADVVAREIVEPGKPAWQAIKDRFGDDALLQDGALNRAWLRQKVFAEPDERKWLESQTHPRIRDEIILAGGGFAAADAAGEAEYIHTQIRLTNMFKEWDSPPHT